MPLKYGNFQTDHCVVIYHKGDHTCEANISKTNDDSNLKDIFNQNCQKTLRRVASDAIILKDPQLSYDEIKNVAGA